MKAVKNIIAALITLAVILLFIWWHFTFEIDKKEGGILPHGADGQVFIIKDSNPVFNFKIVYKGPDFSKEIEINNGDYAVILYNSDLNELYIYSEPQQMTLRVSDVSSSSAFTFKKVGIWQLMFGSKEFFRQGKHSLSLIKR